MMSPITVLVVEDEPLTRMDISERLQELGFKVLEAENAAGAIKVLEDDVNIQVIFTDVDMPGSMNGLMLAAAVRNRWPPIKIIVTSGKREIELEDLPTGSRFMGKPYQAGKLAAMMQEMMK